MDPDKGPEALQHTWGPDPHLPPLGLSYHPSLPNFPWLPATGGRGAPVGLTLSSPGSQSPYLLWVVNSSPVPEVLLLLSTTLQGDYYILQSGLPHFRTGKPGLKKSEASPGHITRKLASQCSTLETAGVCPVGQHSPISLYPPGPCEPLLHALAKLESRDANVPPWSMARSSRTRTRCYSPSPPQGQARRDTQKTLAEGTFPCGQKGHGAGRLLGPQGPGSSSDGD